MTKTITSRNGDELVAFYAGVELTTPAEYAHLPLEFAVVIARHQDGALFVWNTWRQEWELPAGLIKAGESPIDAARRELAEESGQEAVSLAYAGLVVLRLASSGRLEMGAAFRGKIETLRPFRANAETARMMFRNAQTSVSEYVNEIGIALAQLIY